MKKNYLFAGLLSLGMLLVSCGKEDSISGSALDPGFKGEMEEVTPVGSKTRLQDIGIEFIDAINAETHENLVDVVSYIEEKLDNLDMDEEYIEKLERLYTEEGGYDYAPARKTNPVAAIQGLMALSLDAAQQGAQLATRADDIYMLTVRAGLKDLYGGFTPDMKYGEWVYNSSINDRIEVTFTDDHNQTWVATLKGSKETSRIHVTGESLWKNEYEYYEWWSGDVIVKEDSDHEQYDITIDVPQLITFVVKCNQKEVINMNVNSSLAFEADCYSDSYDQSGYDKNGDWFENYKSEFELNVDYSNLNLNASLNVNGYAESWVVKASESSIESSAEVKINGKSMLKASAAVNGDMNAYIKQINKANNYSSYYDGDDYVYDNNFEFDPSCVKNFAMKLDVLGKAQIYGKCDNFEKLYKAIELTEEEYEKKYGKYDEETAWVKQIEEINQAYSITVHYDNKSTVQANIEFEGGAEDQEYYTTYYVRPVLVFAEDNSRYAFEDYFTERSFSRLINKLEELAREFADMYNDYF